MTPDLRVRCPTDGATRHGTRSGEMCLVEVFAGSYRKPEADSYVVRLLCCLHFWCIYLLFGDFENFKIYNGMLNTLPYANSKGSDQPTQTCRMI